MKAIAVFPTRREVRVVEHPEPRITSPTGVMLRTLEVGICGTDHEIVRFEYGTPPPGADYLVIGHESLAEVVDIGPAVQRVKPGDLVVPMVRRPCPHPDCVACTAGRQDFCTTGDYTERGIKGAHGFATERVVDDEAYLNLVPRSLREIAVLAEPLTIAEKALTQVFQVQRRLPWGTPQQPVSSGRPGRAHRAVVLGAGPVGLLGAMAMVRAGFETTVYSRSSGPHDKAGLVASFGATYVAAEDHTLDELAERVGNIDLVYEATGAASVSFQTMERLGNNGVFVFTGVPGRKAPITLDADLIMRRLVLDNQVVLGSVNAGRGDYEAAIADLATFVQRWPTAVGRLITARHALDDAVATLREPPPGIKDVITFN